ncbi:hypothetical protein NDU88_006676 [Pleurodeles waltl]|uniref:Uncharacterized protein n=1 Tax=Pleurodeles waltl TaxID=8319 RepID=A0AAV7ULP7_PLEWA|nr:hypothetical protein NDU88_006676 [Pleurodeles waltl]
MESKWQESLDLVTQKDFFEEKQLVTLRAQHQMAGCAQHVNLQRLMPRTDVHWTIRRKTVRPVDRFDKKKLLEIEEHEDLKWRQRAVNISTSPKKSRRRQQSLSETQTPNTNPKTTEPSQLARM